MNTPMTRYAQSGDAYIGYQVVGDGPIDLVFMPNWFSNIEILWTHPLAERLLERLAGFTRLILFDQRGSGTSDPAPLDQMIVLEERAKDILAVLDAAGSEQAALLSATMTGPLGCFFAATHGDRTHSLVLLDAAVRRPDEQERAEIGALIESIPATWGTSSFINRPEPGREAFFEWIAFYRRMSMGPGAAQAMFRAYADLDATHLLPAIHIPTLVIAHRGAKWSTNFEEETRQLHENIAGAELVVLDEPGESWLGESLAYVTEVERFLSGGQVTYDADRVLATLLFTDIVGSTEQAVALGDSRWLEVLDAHARIVAEQAPRFGGSVVGSEGDGSLTRFDGPARAIRCAVAIRQASRALGVDVRAGLHTGEVELRTGGEIGGIALHIGARVSAMAGAGEILVSSTVKDLVAGSGIAFENRGTHTLKGVPDQWRIFVVTD